MGNESFSTEMYRRCKVLFFESKSDFKLDLKTLVSKEVGLERNVRWLAYAGHLSGPVIVTRLELDALSEIDEVRPRSWMDLVGTYGKEIIEALLSKSLIVRFLDLGDPDDIESRDIAWEPLAKIAYMNSRWSEVEVPNLDDIRAAMKVRPTLRSYKAPPSYRHVPRLVNQVLPMNIQDDRGRCTLLQKRATCRNFDESKGLTFDELSTIASRVWKARDLTTLSNGLEVVSKNSPSGGSIHATEVYFIIRKMDNVQSGLYHYDALTHSLERLGSENEVEVDSIVKSAVAGQDYFASAPVLVVMTTRFDRLLWKYRYHDKAFKVAHMDVGHLSQSLYITATEMDLGVFISAAVNDVKLEKCLNLSPGIEGVVAVCGIGHKVSET